MNKVNLKNCNDCASSRKKWDHLCIRHAPCVSKPLPLWNPGACEICSGWFAMCDDPASKGGRALEGLRVIARKIKAALMRGQKKAPREDIFLSDEISALYKKDFLKKVTTCSEGDDVGEEYQSPSKDSQASSIDWSSMWGKLIPENPTSEEFSLDPMEAGVSENNLAHSHERTQEALSVSGSIPKSSGYREREFHNSQVIPMDSAQGSATRYSPFSVLGNEGIPSGLRNKFYRLESDVRGQAFGGSTSDPNLTYYVDPTTGRSMGTNLHPSRLTTVNCSPGLIMEGNGQSNQTETPHTNLSKSQWVSGLEYVNPGRPRSVYFQNVPTATPTQFVPYGVNPESVKHPVPQSSGKPATFNFAPEDNGGGTVNRLIQVPGRPTTRVGIQGLVPPKGISLRSGIDLHYVGV